MRKYQTGNAEIDQQHAILESLIDQLSVFCSELKLKPGAKCEQCSSVKQQQCASALASITGELTAFLIGHATYEEKMMSLLPDTPSCQAHIKGHKAAHEGILRQLKKLSVGVDNKSPQAICTQMFQVIWNWLGDHIA